MFWPADSVEAGDCYVCWLVPSICDIVNVQQAKRHQSNTRLYWHGHDFIVLALPWLASRDETRQVYRALTSPSWYASSIRRWTERTDSLTVPALRSVFSSSFSRLLGYPLRHNPWLWSVGHSNYAISTSCKIGSIVVWTNLFTALHNCMGLCIDWTIKQP